MAFDLKWLLSADDKATPVFDKVQAAGKGMADGISGTVDSLVAKFNLVPSAIGLMSTALAGAGFGAIAQSAANYDLSVASLGKTIGMTLQDASVFKVALDDAGISTDTASAAALRMAKTLTTNSGAFQQAGVDIDAMRASGASNIDIMMATVTALGNTRAGFDRNGLAMQIFNRSWSDVQSLIKLTPELMDHARESTDKLGLSVGQGNVDAAKAYKIELNELHTATTSLSVTLGNELLPTLVSAGKEMVELANGGAHLFGAGIKSVEQNSDAAVIAVMGFAAPAIVSGVTSLGAAVAGLGAEIGAMSLTATTGLYGLLAAATYMAGNAAVKITYQTAGIDLTGEQAPLDQLSKDQDALGKNTAALNAKLKELGYTSWTEFDKAAKAGKVVFDEMSNTWNTKDALAGADKAKLDLMDKELAAAKELSSQQEALAKGRSEVELAVMKNGFDLGEVATSAYYTKTNQIAMDAAQQKFQAAEEYLGKEKVVLDYVAQTYGEHSAEYQAELAKNAKAVEGVQQAELGYAKTYVDGQGKMTQELRARQEAYDKIHDATLQASGDYIAASVLEIAMEQKSTDMIKLKADALAGVADAIKAVSEKETEWLTKEATANEKENDTLRSWADQYQTLSGTIDGLMGKDADWLKAKQDLFTEEGKLGTLRDQLNVAAAAGNAKDLGGLNAVIPLEKQLIDIKQQQLDSAQRFITLTHDVNLLTLQGDVAALLGDKSRKDGLDAIVKSMTDEKTATKAINDATLALNVAVAAGDTAQINYETQILTALKAKLALTQQNTAAANDMATAMEQAAVIAGKIVGFSNGQAVTANGGTAFDNGTAVSQYVSPSSLVKNPTGSALQSNSPFVSLTSPLFPYLDVGTPYVKRTGLAVIHEGEAVVTAADNARGNYGGITVHPGGIQITVQGGDTAAATVDELARQLMPKLDALARRRRAA